VETEVKNPLMASNHQDLGSLKENVCKLKKKFRGFFIADAARWYSSNLNTIIRNDGDDGINYSMGVSL
jgi:hypothetical protein